MMTGTINTTSTSIWCGYTAALWTRNHAWCSPLTSYGDDPVSVPFIQMCLLIYAPVSVLIFISWTKLSPLILYLTYLQFFCCFIVFCMKNATWIACDQNTCVFVLYSKCMWTDHELDIFVSLFNCIYICKYHISFIHIQII